MAIRSQELFTSRIVVVRYRDHDAGAVRSQGPCRFVEPAQATREETTVSGRARLRASPPLLVHWLWFMSACRL